MMLKTDTLGWLLNAEVLLAALGAALPRWAGRWVWSAVLPIGLAAIAVRWFTVCHPPLRNVFEAFLWLPPILAGATLLTRWRDGVWTVRWDALLGFIVAFPLAFVFSAEEGLLPPALQSPLFVPHVLGYMLAYALLARAFLLSCLRIEDVSRRSLAWGFFLMTLALALGAVWGNEAWGGYWQWDPKEQWSLATWLIYAALLHVPGKRPLRLTLLGLGLLAVILTVTWVNLSRLFPGMHSYAGL